MCCDAGQVKSTDDAFDIYKKRMMLAYRHRPNPLVCLRLVAFSVASVGPENTSLCLCVCLLTHIYILCVCPTLLEQPTEEVLVMVDHGPCRREGVSREAQGGRGWTSCSEKCSNSPSSPWCFLTQYFIFLSLNPTPCILSPSCPLVHCLNEVPESRLVFRQSSTPGLLEGVLLTIPLWAVRIPHAIILCHIS